MEFPCIFIERDPFTGNFSVIVLIVSKLQLYDSAKYELKKQFCHLNKNKCQKKLSSWRYNKIMEIPSLHEFLRCVFHFCLDTVDLGDWE